MKARGQFLMIKDRSLMANHQTCGFCFAKTIQNLLPFTEKIR